MAKKKRAVGGKDPAPATSRELLEKRRTYLRELQERRRREKEELSRMLGKKSSRMRSPGGGFRKDTFSPGHSGNK